MRGEGRPRGGRVLGSKGAERVKAEGNEATVFLGGEVAERRRGGGRRSEGNGYS